MGFSQLVLLLQFCRRLVLNWLQIVIDMSQVEKKSENFQQRPKQFPKSSYAKVMYIKTLFYRGP